jgi:hypothetical protein
MRDIESLNKIDERFYIQIITKTTINCSLAHEHDGIKGICYDEVDERGENLTVIIKDLKNCPHEVVFNHVNHMSDAQLYEFILEQIDEILEQD